MDTNVVLRAFGTRAPFLAIRRAVLAGRLELAFSNEMLLEYEEMAIRLAGAAYWNRIIEFFDVTSQLHDNIFQVSPTFRFGLIVTDPDDNKFVDCAITASSDYLVTEDRHFHVLAGSGYRPQVISPQTFIDKFLAP